MEAASSEEVQGFLQLLRHIEQQDLDYKKVEGNQIIGALLKEVGVQFAKGYLYQVLQGVANEARRRSLLINPNEFDRRTYSAAVGNTGRMLPSSVGWEQTKGILMRHLAEAEAYLAKIMRERPTGYRNDTLFGPVSSQVAAMAVCGQL
jgi:hypothetical protein